MVQTILVLVPTIFEQDQKWLSILNFSFWPMSKLFSPFPLSPGSFGPTMNSTKAIFHKLHTICLFCFEKWESMKLLIKCHNNRSRLNKFVFPSSNYFHKFALPILLMIHNICHIPEPDLNLYFHHIKRRVHIGQHSHNLQLPPFRNFHH